MKIKNIILGSFLIMSSISSFSQEAQVFRSPLISTSNWIGWNLHLINLDKNNKPKDQTKVDLAKDAKIQHKDLSLSIFPESIDENSGKVIRFTCEKDKVVLTQKFGSPDQLKGFALQMPCNKQNYYFIVNPNQS